MKSFYYYLDVPYEQKICFFVLYSYCNFPNQDLRILNMGMWVEVEIVKAVAQLNAILLNSSHKLAL